MKILIVSESDIDGGAARASYRIHKSLLSFGINSFIYTSRKLTDDWRIIGPNSFSHKFFSKIKLLASTLLIKFFTKGTGHLRSLALWPSSNYLFINYSDFDIVHLNWINNEMFSIRDISLIDKPLIWTLHDMWLFCATEHYSTDTNWISGYNKNNFIIDFDYNLWNKKIKYLINKDITIVTPSKWLAECVSNSKLLGNKPVHVIPNPLDVNFWKPINKIYCRNVLNLDPHVPIILFGAIGGVANFRKGYDLLIESIKNLSDIFPNLELLIFGQSEPLNNLDLKFPTHYLGHLHDDISMNIVYNAADVMAVPSRIEAFGQTASEAMSCGCPVVAFDTSGLRDIVSNGINGYLAKPFDTKDFSTGLISILSSSDLRAKFSIEARNFALKNWSYEVVSNQYSQIYTKILNI